VNQGIYEEPAANFAAGSPVVGGTVFQGNNSNSTISGPGLDFNIGLNRYQPVFEDAPDRNFYPAEFSQVIDSAISTFQDRSDFAGRVKAGIGLPPSPLLAPTTDATGELRVDDPLVASPQGTGVSPFIDRGALDRSDFTSPTAALISPQDNDAQGVDIDPAPNRVQIGSGNVTDFAVQIQDQTGVGNPYPGTGADNNTIAQTPINITDNGLPVTLNGPDVRVLENGKLLLEGYDYTFSYDSAAKTIHLTPLAGAWAPDAVYTIQLNNKDRYLVNAAPGQSSVDGQTFVITDATGSKTTFE
jgi:hypothetical protein